MTREEAERFVGTIETIFTDCPWEYEAIGVNLYAPGSPFEHVICPKDEHGDCQTDDCACEGGGEYWKTPRDWPAFLRDVLAALAPPATSETETCDHGHLRRSWELCERDAEIERLKERISHDHEKCGWCGLAHGPGWYNGVNEEPDGWAECFYRNEVDRITHELSALREGVRAAWSKYDVMRHNVIAYGGGGETVSCPYCHVTEIPLSFTEDAVKQAWELGMTRVEIARLTHERDEAKKSLEFYIGICAADNALQTDLSNQIDSLRAENERLRAALRGIGEHIAGCHGKADQYDCAAIEDMVHRALEEGKP